MVSLPLAVWALVVCHKSVRQSFLLGIPPLEAPDSKLYTIYKRILTDLSIETKILFVTQQIIAVTVNPYPCPTNKIAPHRRISTVRSNGDKSRTIGAYIDLLAPDFSQQNPLNSLQEEPQEDDPDDCGDIEDYDENDLSSVTSQFQQQPSYNNGPRLFFNGFMRPPRPPAYPPYPGSVQPSRPPLNYPPPRPPPNYPPPRPPPNYPTPRPPYWSGGQFGSNPYRPPIHHNPSDSIKPVYEPGVNDEPPPYRPGVVGGPSHHVVGAPTTPIRPPRPRPTKRPITEPPQREPVPDRYPTPSQSTTRRPRPRRLNNDGIIGSFLDLLF